MQVGLDSTAVPERVNALSGGSSPEEVPAVEDALSKGPEIPQSSKVIPSEAEDSPPVIDSRGEIVKDDGKPRNIRGGAPWQVCGQDC